MLKTILLFLFLACCVSSFPQSIELPLDINNAILSTKLKSIAPAVRSYVLVSGNSNLREIALTFDDGYNYDERILDLLQSYNIKATAFIVGAVAEKHPDFIKRLDSMSWEIGNHTYDHPWMSRTDNNKLAEEIRQAEKILREVLGRDPVRYFRPPFGDYNARVLEDISFDSYKIIFWSNDIRDTTRNPVVEDQVKYALDHLKNGNIILCHFGGRNTYEVLKLLIPEILAQGYKFVTISEMIQHI